MKIYAVSDLHLEFSNFMPPDSSDKADVIVLAGDIWKKDHGIYWARATWPDKEIIYIAGNHEFYGYQRQEVLTRLRTAAESTGVHFLDNQEVTIQGVRFLGCTLWTDFKLYGADQQQESMVAAQQCLTDFRVIYEGVQAFSPIHSITLHEESVDWLNKQLEWEMPTVVVTHHAPSWNSVVPRFQEDFVSAAFASRLEHLMGTPKLWIHGHMHDTLEYELGGTKVICNPRGYTSYSNGDENRSFDPDLMIELEEGQVTVRHGKAYSHFNATANP